jgi:ligand-binding sensor domain-containing protein
MMQKFKPKRTPSPIGEVERGGRPFLLFFLFFCCYNSVAQQYNFKNYTVQHGLGSASVNHIFQDSKGYIWFATQNGGASRFNGTTFHTYTKADGLINNDVTYIAEDHKGNIWFATAAGASRFNGTTFQNFTAQNGLTGGSVFVIHADAGNKIWFATQDAGIRIFNGTTFDSLTIKDGLPSNEAYTIVQDSKGNYWLGLADGIVQYSNGKITSYHEHPMIKDKVFFSALVDKDDNVWFGATGGEVVCFRNNNTIEQVILPPLHRHDFIGDIAQDKRGNIWLATDHGLLKYNGSGFITFTEQNGFSSNIAQTVMCDYEGNVWAGTLGDGIYLLASEAWIRYTAKDGLSGKNITAICATPHEETYYIGTNDGLFAFLPHSENPFIRINKNKLIEHLNVTTLSVNGNGDVWTGTQEAIYVLEKAGNSLRLKESFSKIADEQIISPTKILHDKKGNIWIATYGSGLFYLTLPLSKEEGTYTYEEKSFNTSTGFPSDKILTLFEDAKNHIWIGTQDAGIIKYDGNTFSPLPWRGVGGEAAIWAITSDVSGNIYWGSSESGLYRYDGNNIINYTSDKNGLSSDYITTLKWDAADKCIWAGSEKGLDKIQFTKDGKIKKLKSFKEHPSMNQDALNINEHGYLLLGTVNGLWLFSRHFETTENTAPKIQLTGIRLFYQNSDWKKTSDSIDATTQKPPHFRYSGAYHATSSIFVYSGRL